MEASNDGCIPYSDGASIRKPKRTRNICREMVENLQGGGSVCSRGFFGWKGKPGTKKKEADDDAIIVYIVFYVVLLGSIPLLGMLHFCPPFFVACVGVRFIPSLSLSLSRSLLRCMHTCRAFGLSSKFLTCRSKSPS